MSKLKRTHMPLTVCSLISAEQMQQLAYYTSEYFPLET